MFRRWDVLVVVNWFRLSPGLKDRGKNRFSRVADQRGPVLGKHGQTTRKNHFR